LKQLRKFGDNRFKSLADLLEKYETNPDKDILHRVRLELKKIRALYNLIDYCSKNFNAAEKFIPLKKIFNDAGKIRDIDIANKLFLEYHIKFIHHETDIVMQAKLISNFRKNIPHYKKSIAKNQKSSEKYFEKMNADCFKKYIDIQNDKLQKQIYPKLNESGLHKVRKKIKEIIYLSSISIRNSKDMISFYDNIQDVIGIWHDKKVLLELLKKQVFDSQKNVIEKLELQCATDLKILEEMISNFYKQKDATIQ
jgi:CHAD domain-containing protein